VRCGGFFEVDAIVCVRLGYSRLLPSEFVGNLELQQTLIGSHQIRALHPEAIVWQPSYSAHPTAPPPYTGLLQLPFQSGSGGTSSATPWLVLDKLADRSQLLPQYGVTSG
jgi:hypothetical protein